MMDPKNKWRVLYATISSIPPSSEINLFVSLLAPMDDEYARAGIRDPKIMITTSRDPSSRLNQFVKVRHSPPSQLAFFFFKSLYHLSPTFFPFQEMHLVFPNSQKLNRGNYVVKQLIETCRSNEVTDLIIIHEHRGEPGTNSVCPPPSIYCAHLIHSVPMQMAWSFLTFHMGLRLTLGCTIACCDTISKTEAPFHSSTLTWYSTALTQN